MFEETVEVGILNVFSKYQGVESHDKEDNATKMFVPYNSSNTRKKQLWQKKFNKQLFGLQYR